jgi:hypothetical protein
MGYSASSTKFSRAQSSRSKQTTTYTSSTNEGITIAGAAVTATTVAFVEVSNPGAASTTSPVSATITSLTYLDSTNVPSSTTAVDSTGGGNILITGTGFTNTTRVFIDDAQVTSSFVNSTSIIATVGAHIVGNALLAIFNSSNTGGALSPTPVRYSGAPVWITDSASLYSYNGIASNIALQTTGDGAITYSLKAGSGSLPTGITLSSAGYLSGTATGYTTDTAVPFTLVATDVDGQASQKAFTYTVYIGDTYFKNTTLLLNGDIGNTFITDASTNNYFLTRFGDTRPSRLSPFSTGGGSGYFDGTGDYISVPTFYISTSDYTFETWIYPTTAGSVQTILSYGPTGSTFRLFFDVSRFWFLIGSTSIIQMPAGTSPETNVWYHVAITRSGSGTNNTKLFINGNIIAQTTNTSDFNAGAPLIGAESGSSNFFNGYMSNMRVVKGSALYTANFTPSISMLTPVANTQLLTLQSNVAVNSSQFLDESANSFVITRAGNTSQGSFSPYFPGGWSAFFDGTGDYISLPDNEVFNFGASNFTIECWVYTIGGTGEYAIYGQRASSLVYTPVYLGMKAGGIYILASDGASWIINPGFASGNAVTPNVWSHIALVRNGSNFTAYINGQAGQSGTSAATLINPTDNVTIGASSAAGDTPWLGYISNLRVVKGTALYTANFTPNVTIFSAYDTANTSLLMLRGSTLTDDSATGSPLTPTGDTKTTTFSPFSSFTITPKSFSYKFSGTLDYLSNVSSNLAMSTGDFTIESWVYSRAGSNNGVFQISGNTYGLANSNTNTLAVGISSNKAVVKANNNSYTSTGVSILGNAWNHIALTRLAGNTRLFINGNLDNTVGLTGNIVDSVNYTSANIAIGGYNTTGNLLNGYISNFRVVKGSALYTANFTVSSTPLSIVSGTALLTANSATISEVSNNLTLTGNGNVTPSKYNPFGETVTSAVAYDQGLHGGSAYFDGTGDYLTTPSNLAFAFGTGDFTIEGWFYFSGTISTYQRIWWFSTDTDNTEINSSALRFGGTGQTTITGSTLTANRWYHIAYTRQSSNGKLFLDGVQVGATTTNSYNSSTARTLTIFATSAGLNPATGYVSNFRVIKGTAVYTGNFVPPTAPAAPTSNTSLLLNFTSNGIVDLTGKSVLESNADVRVTSNVKNFGSGSYYFDGTSDFLLVNTRSPEAYAFANADFTIEMWYNPYITSVRQTLYDARPSASEGVYPTLYLDSTNSIRYYVSSVDRIVGGSLTANTWQHIAVSRTSNTTRLFINGTQTGAAYTDNNVYLNGAQRPVIGSNGTVGTSVLNGYIDDLRITKGYSRYSGNFSVPIYTFPSR